MLKGLTTLAKIVAGGVLILYLYEIVGLGYEEASHTHESMEEASFDDMYKIGRDMGRRAREGWKWAFKN